MLKRLRVSTAPARRRSTSCFATACWWTSTRSCATPCALPAVVPDQGQLEALYRGSERQTAVGEGGESIEVFEEWLETGEESLLEAIEEYNADDCRSTRELRDWLLERRQESLAKSGVAFPYAAPDPDAASDERRDIDAETSKLIVELLDGVPPEPDDRDAEQQARWLLAQSCSTTTAASNASWWRFFELCAMDDEQAAPRSSRRSAGSSRSGNRRSSVSTARPHSGSASPPRSSSSVRAMSVTQRPRQVRARCSRSTRLRGACGSSAPRDS